MVMFYEALSQTNTVKKPKLTLKRGMSMEIIYFQWGVIYQMKGLANSISMVMFSKTLTETITIESLKHVFCQLTFFQNL